MSFSVIMKIALGRGAADSFEARVTTLALMAAMLLLTIVPLGWMIWMEPGAPDVIDGALSRVT